MFLVSDTKRSLQHPQVVQDAPVLSFPLAGGAPMLVDTYLLLRKAQNILEVQKYFPNENQAKTYHGQCLVSYH